MTPLPNEWARGAIALLTLEEAVATANPLRRFPLPDEWPVTLLLKDESANPVGSVEHRLARALLVDALSRGRVDENTPLVDAADGAMAVAEAYFARILELPFTAVLSARTPWQNLALIEEQDGNWYPVDPPLAAYDRARALADEIGGYHLDYLTNIEDAVDSPASGDLAAEILDELAEAGRPAPEWIILGAGSGASSRAVGRWLRRRNHPTRLAVVNTTGVAPAFDAAVVDTVRPVAEAASVAAMRHLNAVTGLCAGPSTGSCLWGAFQLVHRLLETGSPGTVVMVVGDSGLPYRNTYYDDAWVLDKGWDLTTPTEQLERFTRTGAWATGPRS